MVDLTISAAELASSRVGLVFDVRAVSERYEGLGYIPGSCSLPFDPAQFDVETLRQNAPSGIVLVCLSGKRSDEAARVMRDAGLLNVQSVQGGILAWRAAGYPVCGVDTHASAEIPEVRDASSFVLAVKSCFVAEWAQNCTVDDGFDPVALVQSAFAGVRWNMRDLRCAVERVSGVAWRRGYPLATIAANVDRMLAVIARLDERGILEAC